MAVLKIEDFSGGLWLAASEDDPPENCCSRFRGVDKGSRKAAKSRKGSDVLEASHDADAIIYFSGHWYSAINGQLYRDFTTLGASGLSSSGLRMSFAVANPTPGNYVSWLYCCNAGNQGYAVNSTTVRKWGIDKPTTVGLVSAAGTGTNMDPTTNYGYCYTYYNASTACESNPSTPSWGSSTAGGACTFSGMASSGDSQVTHKNIYRTTGGGSTFYYHSTISDATNTLDDQTGDDYLSNTIVNENNADPGASFQSCCYFKTTMFWLYVDSGRIYYSRPGYPESVEGFITLGSYKHDGPQKLIAFGGDLYCVCRYSVYQIYGDNPWLSRYLGGIAGTKDPESVVTTPQGVFWVAHDGVRVFTGGSQALVAGGKAIYESFIGNTSGTVYPINIYTCFAAFFQNEYVIGHNQGTLAYDVVTGRWRDVGIECDGLIYYESYVDECIINLSGDLLELESGTWQDGSTDFTFDVRTRVIKFEAPVRIANISVEMTNASATTVYAAAYYHDNYAILGTCSTSSGRRVSDFDSEAIVTAIALRCYTTAMSGRVTLHGFRVEYFPVVLRVLGDDPCEIPANFESGMSLLAFNFRDGNSQEACKLYRYDIMNLDIDDGASSLALMYTQSGGSNVAIDTLSGGTRQQRQYEMNIMGPMVRFYFSGTLTNYDTAIYDFTVHRSAVKLLVDFGDHQTEINGYIDGNRGYVRFNLEINQQATLQRCYLFERLTYYGDPDGTTITAYIDLMHAAATSLGTNASSGVDYIHFDIDRIGILEEVYFTGTFSPTGSILYRAELVARPVTLKCRFGDEVFEIPGYYGEGSTTVVFDFKPFKPTTLDRVYFFERLIYDIDTNSNATTFTFTINPLSSGITTSSINQANRTVDAYEINQIGRIESLTFNVAAGSASVAIYDLELIAKPLTLDINYGDGQISIEGHQQGTTTISFDLSPMQEMTQNKLYFWERFMLEGDLNSVSITPQPFFADNSGYSLTAVSPSAREICSQDVNRLGRLDALDLVGDFTSAFYINKVELIAKPVSLDIWLGGQKKSVPGYWHSNVSDLVFDLSPLEEDSANSVYLFERFMVDADTSGITLTPKLSLVDRSEVSLSTFSSSAREVQVITMNRTGRLDKFIIDPIATSDFAIYKLEMIVNPVVLEVWIGDQKKVVQGYLDNTDSITFDLSPVYEDSTKQAYLYEKLLLEGNTGSNIVTAYLTLNGQSEASLGTMNTGSKAVVEISVEKTGRVDSLRLSGVTVTGIYVSKVELICKPLMLDIWIDDQKKQISGYLAGASNDIIFDLSPIHEDSAKNIYLYEKLILEGNTDSVTITPRITLSGESEASLSTFSSAAKDVQDIAIAKTGRIDKLRFTSSFDPDIYLSKVEIICKTLKLDLFLAGKQMSVPGYLDQNASLQFDLSPLQESPVNQIYLFERLLLDGDTNDTTVTPYVTLIGGSEFALSTFDVAVRSVQDYVVDRMGRLDRMRLDTVTWDPDIYIQHIELIANPIMLTVYLNGEPHQFPGRYRDYNGEVFFEIYPLFQQALYTKYVLHSFYYDIDPGSVSLQFDLQLIGESDLTILTTNAATRTEGEVFLTKTGRPSNLTIQGLFTGPTPVIYKLELEMTGRRGFQK